MALQLMKLAISAETTVTVDPSSVKFFYVAVADTAAGVTLTIDAADFFDDTGAAVTVLPVLAAGNSMYTVYVNGVLQMDGISTYTPGATGVGSLEIDVPPGGGGIMTGSPIVLEIVQFAPDATTAVET